MFLVVFVHKNGQELLQGHNIPVDTSGGDVSFVKQYITQGVFLHEYVQSIYQYYPLVIGVAVLLFC